MLNEISDGERIEVDAEGEGLLGEFTFKSQQFDVAELDESSKDSSDLSNDVSADDSSDSKASGDDSALGTANNSDNEAADKTGSETK